VWTFIGHGSGSVRITRSLGRKLIFNSGDATTAQYSYLTTNDWVKEVTNGTEKVALIKLPNALEGNPPNQRQVKPLSYVGLAAFFGCNTSYAYQNRTDPKLETLTEVAHRQGARAAIGLRGELKAGQIAKFAERFYFYVGEGSTISIAMKNAVAEAGMKDQKDRYGIGTGADIAGDFNTKLDGPKWGSQR
jgi:hypothetical protein